MLAHVRQRLLGNPEQDDPGFGRWLRREPSVDAELRPRLGLELPKLETQRRFEAFVVEDRRSELEEQVAQPPERLLDRASETLGLRPDLALRYVPTEHLESERDGDHRLDRVVVDIGSHAPPLL